MKIILETEKTKEDNLKLITSIEKEGVFVEVDLSELPDDEFEQIKVLMNMFFNEVVSIDENRRTKNDITKFELANPDIAKLVKDGVLSYQFFTGSFSGSKFHEGGFYFRNRKDIMIQNLGDGWIVMQMSCDARTRPQTNHGSIQEAVEYAKLYYDE